MITNKTFCGALALLAALPLHAAVSVSADGTGQALLFPYATIEQGNTTLIAIDNTRDRAKAVKWHIRESREGHIAASGIAYVPAKGRWSLALLDHQQIGSIFLEPGATGCAPRKDENGMDAIVIHTFPDGEPSGTDFWATATVAFDAVEMGELDDSLTQAVAQDCSQIWNRWRVTGPGSVGEWVENPRADMSAPSGGLRGTATLLDVADGTLVDYPAVAFEGHSRSVRTDIAHFQTPYLTDIEPEADGYIHVALPGGRSLRYSADRGADALSALLAARASSVEFAADLSLSGRSDIVIALPTRASYVGGVIDRPYNEESLNETPQLLAPFTRPDCESVRIALRGMDGKPQGEDTAELCGLATVLRVRQSQSAAQPDLVADERAIPVSADRQGTMKLEFADSEHKRLSRPDADGKCWSGLPAWVLSISAWSVANGEPLPEQPLVRASQATSTFEINDCR